MIVADCSTYHFIPNYFLTALSVPLAESGLLAPPEVIFGDFLHIFGPVGSFFDFFSSLGLILMIMLTHLASHVDFYLHFGDFW